MMLDGADLDERELEGAARFLVDSGRPPSWPSTPFPDGMAVFRNAAKDPVRVPAGLLARLTAHLQREADPDKQARAQLLVAAS